MGFLLAALLMLAPVEQQMIDVTNQSRASVGLSELRVDAGMVEAARARAGQQRGPVLSHFDEAGLAFFRVAPQAMAENLAYSYPWDVAGIERAFLNSPSHRANVLDPSWRYIAVGAWDDPSGAGGDLAELYR